MSAVKHDAGKLPVMTGVFNYFPRALREVARVSDLGIAKYGPGGGWRHVEDGLCRYSDACGRHILEHGAGFVVNEEVLPEDSQLQSYRVLHLAQVAWNALAALELDIQECETAVSGKTIAEIFSLGPVDKGAE